MIAGPNGSGKSTLIRELVLRGVALGRYINADEIDASLPGPPGEERSRRAQALAEEARRECLDQGIDFSFETVMSHRSKIELLRDARRRGYAIVIFFVATESPLLNVERVRQRVALGGHPVPEDRIVARYERALALLPEAISQCDRARQGGPVRLVAVSEVRPQREASAYAIVDLRDRPEWVRRVLERLETCPPSGN
jgi:predicted ABC-type ATPase